MQKLKGFSNRIVLLKILRQLAFCFNTNTKCNYKFERTHVSHILTAFNILVLHIISNRLLFLLSVFISFMYGLFNDSLNSRVLYGYG
jgi:hypothetical protein